MWKYKDKVINEIKDLGEITPFGFIYITTHIPTGKKYIGKKALFHNIKKKLTQKELTYKIGPGRKSLTKTIQKESDWKKYYGSAKYVVDLIKQGKQSEFEREILHICYDKKLLTYFECKYLFEYSVLEHPEIFINDNILGKFFSVDFPKNTEISL